MDSKEVLKFSSLAASSSVEIMKQSFKYWHERYTDSMINYSLVWKKALESNSEILEKIEKLRKNSEHGTDVIIEQFFDMWSQAIRESNFEMAIKSVQKQGEFWKNLTGEQFTLCNEIFQMIGKYWKDIQNKNIE